MYTKQNIWDFIAGEPAIDRTTEAPWGNYPDGRVIEEYRIREGWLQVAFNPALGNDIDDWQLSETEPDTWLV